MITKQETCIHKFFLLVFLFLRPIFVCSCATPFHPKHEIWGEKQLCEQLLLSDQSLKSKILNMAELDRVGGLRSELVDYVLHCHGLKSKVLFYSWWTAVGVGGLLAQNWWILFFIATA